MKCWNCHRCIVCHRCSEGYHDVVTVPDRENLSYPRIVELNGTDLTAHWAYTNKEQARIAEMRVRDMQIEDIYAEPSDTLCRFIIDADKYR